MSTLVMLEELQRLRSENQQLMSQLKQTKEDITLQLRALKKDFDAKISAVTDHIKRCSENTINLSSWYEFDSVSVASFKKKYPNGAVIGLHPYLREIIGCQPGDTVAVTYRGTITEAVLEMTDSRIENNPKLSPIDTVLRGIQLSQVLRQKLGLNTYGADIVKYQLEKGKIHLHTWY